ncbi:hypothetical protein SG34_017440 [Thalassomonas viridans]|uniref:Uncharacterized protein n=1 Tax=Thalassomonas viridans TaxID=137584 RepID=A0AAF0C5C9_9GAMM|nr:hypothetical protein [Thalassomonas viridans]WDE03192.1 hypothetical protein SG34_017440 [Thalassomonas viridans]
MRFTKRVLISLLPLAFTGSTLADTVTAELEFTKRPPFTGLIYLVDNKTSSSQVTVDQKDKQFTKKLQVGSSGQKIKFNNSDDVEHNIFTNETKHSANFDVGLMQPGSTSEVALNWQENSIVRIGCKIHPKMRAYIANILSDYYQVLDFEKKKKNYQIQINDVPSTLTTMNLLMPGYKNMEFELQPGETKEIPISKKGKQRGTLKLSRQ